MNALGATTKTQWPFWKNTRELAERCVIIGFCLISLEQKQIEKISSVPGPPGHFNLKNFRWISRTKILPLLRSWHLKSSDRQVFKVYFFWNLKSFPFKKFSHCNAHSVTHGPPSNQIDLRISRDPVRVKNDPW